jgi:8-oxo-dGTP pyrophosphatase MutT (NUDIX family)
MQRILSAGGIVFRRARGRAEVLLVTARKRRKRWVLPKGRVHRGEQPRAAAVRECREEAGVTGRVVEPAGVVEYGTKAGRMRVEYFIIEFKREVEHDEDDRDHQWCPVEDAIALLTYASARRVLLEAHPRLSALARRRPGSLLPRRRSSDPVS